jgi:hypothetical protein
MSNGKPPLADTPPKARGSIPTGFFTKTHLRRVGDAVQKELYKMFTATKNDDFFEKILPMDRKDVEDIFRKLRKSKIYHKGRWMKLPKDSGKGASEANPYKPFIAIAEKVRSIANDMADKGPQRKETIQGQWVDCSYRVSDSKNLSGPKIRPDIALVCIRSNPELLRKHNARLEELYELRGVRTRAMTAVRY